MCKNVDIYIKKLMDYLKEKGIFEDTLIIFTSYHGYFNGDHQMIQKFNCTYDGCTRIPLVIAYPGSSKPGRQYPHPVNLADLPSTICDILGFERLEKDQGISMANIIMSDEYEKREYTVTESGISSEVLTKKDIENFPNHRYDRSPVGRWCYDPPHRYGGKVYSIRSTDYKLIVRLTQVSEFYDLKNDSWETKNEYNNPKFAGEILKHYEYLSQHLCRIATQREGTAIASWDEFYRAGGDKTWDESYEDHIKK